MYGHVYTLTVDLLEGEPVDDDPEVVEKGEGDDHGPVVAEPARGVEDERPVGRTGTEAPRARLARVAAATALLLLLLGRVAPAIRSERCVQARGWLAEGLGRQRRLARRAFAICG